MIHCVAISIFLFQPQPPSHRPSLGGGGCLIDNAYHSIYLAEKLLGSKVKSINALTDTFTHKYDVEDTAILTMSHHNGGLSSIQASWAITSGRHVAQRVHELHGTKGSFIFDYDGIPLALFHKNQESFTPLSVKPERNDDAGYYNFSGHFMVLCRLLTRYSTKNYITIINEFGFHSNYT